jgi:tRNA uridine 5-carboxymethylaminomethyl modification enzyme
MRKQVNIAAEKNDFVRLESKSMSQSEWRSHLTLSKQLKVQLPLADLLRRPGFHYVDLDQYGLTSQSRPK